MSLPAGAVLQRKCACGGSAELTGDCDACKRKKLLGQPLQRKLTINEPGDQYEQEADRVAEQVMAIPAHSVVKGTSPSIRRFTGQSNDQVNEVPASVYRVLAGSGNPLGSVLRQNMEQRFGHEFSRVRVHTGSDAEQSTQDVNAQAYTVGHNIVFGEGRFAPETTVGRRLIAHELTHVVQQSLIRTANHYGSTSNNEQSTPVALQRQSGSRPSSEDVWGLTVTRSMCGCRQRVRDGIAWANTAGSTYATCDVPTNPTASDVEACFNAAHPTAVVGATTSSSGTMTLPPPSVDPCQRIEDKGILVHETFHSRHADAMARARGTAFFREWQRLAGVPDRLDRLRPTFPAEVAAFEAQWNDGHDWAQDEVNSYRWQRRFLESALNTLNRIC